jgi:hypothetical protein
MGRNLDLAQQAQERPRTTTPAREMMVEETPTPGEMLINLPCVERGSADTDGTTPPIAVKIWSDMLQAAVWVVANDLPKAAWPTDAPVYTHTEVQILTQVGPDTLDWVHTTKAMFGTRIVRGQRRSVSPLRGGASTSKGLANDGQYQHNSLSDAPVAAMSVYEQVSEN